MSGCTQEGLIFGYYKPVLTWITLTVLLFNLSLSSSPHFFLNVGISGLLTKKHGLNHGDKSSFQKWSSCDGRTSYTIFSAWRLKPLCVKQLPNIQILSSWLLIYAHISGFAYFQLIRSGALSTPCCWQDSHLWALSTKCKCSHLGDAVDVWGGGLYHFWIFIHFRSIVYLSGIVAVMFCGLSQARYTVLNLSSEGRARIKQVG